MAKVGRNEALIEEYIGVLERLKQLGSRREELETMIKDLPDDWSIIGRSSS